MFEKENNYHNLYQRKGYKIDHWYQRLSNGHVHTFLIHDQGGSFIPTISRLIKKFVPAKSRNGKPIHIYKKEIDVRDPHHIEYKLYIRYK